MRRPAAAPVWRASNALTRSAAASVRVIGLKGLRIIPLHMDELYHTQRQLGSLRHPIAVPGRVPDQLNVYLSNRFNCFYGVLHHTRHTAGNRASRGRQGHLDANIAGRIDIDVIDEPKLVNIDRDFRIVDRMQGLHDPESQRFQFIGSERARRVCRRPLVGLLRLFRHGRRILHHSLSSLSVLTVCALFRAAMSVCQERVAHFTRIGYSRTPDKTVSLSSSPAAAPWQALLPVISSWKLSNSARASASLLPLTISVMSEAEAMEMAQPRPWKPTSATLPSSMVRNTATLSPHKGLSPLASRLAWSGRRKFRGWRLWSRMTS